MFIADQNLHPVFNADDLHDCFWISMFFDFPELEMRAYCSL